MFSKNQAGCLYFGQIGWKYYNQLRKKAVEQEFSWSGLLISLSIAFFIVVISAYSLRIVNRSFVANGQAKPLKENVYNIKPGCQQNLALESVSINLYNRG